MQEWIYFFERFLVLVSKPFLDALNVSITAGWIVIAVLAIRFAFRKAPKWVNCILWGIVGFRLVLPFSIESVFSLIPSTQTVAPDDIIYYDSFSIDTGFEVVDNAVNVLYAGAEVAPGTEVELTGIMAFLWIVVVLIMLSYAMGSWVKLRLKLRTAIKKEGNIYCSDSVSSPFVLGLLRPRIYLPFSVGSEDEPMIIAHERAHIKRLDHIVKPLGFVLLSIYWFNPMLWLAYILLCRDIESACDERVINQLGEDCRRSYSKALLNASISRRSIAACPLAFGEVGVKERIKGVMNYKKPALWVMVAAVAICAIAAVCFLTDPKDNNTDIGIPISSVSPELRSAISSAIIEYNKDAYTGEYGCEAHTILAINSMGDSEEDNVSHMEMVYLMTMYNRYDKNDGGVKNTGGCIVPAVLTFSVEADGSYNLIEYWEPEDGSNYQLSLKLKFPKGVDYDTQTYAEQLEKNCELQALKYFGLSTNQTEATTGTEYTTQAVSASQRVDDDYSLRAVGTNEDGVRVLTSGAFAKGNGFHVYLIGINEIYITLDDKEYKLGDALNSGSASIDKLMKKLKSDANSGKIKSEMYKDGGTLLYDAAGYVVIRCNTLDGNRDVYICRSGMNLNSAQEALEGAEDVVGVTAPVSYNDQPAFDAFVVENNGGTLLVETFSDGKGITKGTKVNVRLSTVLSYLPNIAPELIEKGDKIRVIFDDTNIMETYPIQVNAWAVYKYVE